MSKRQVEKVRVNAHRPARFRRARKNFAETRGHKLRNINRGSKVIAMARTVLIVDDSKLARMVACKALAKIHPDWALRRSRRCDAGAWRALQAQYVDISLIDLNMPGDGGLALAADLRRQQPEHADRRRHRQYPGRDHRARARVRCDIRPQAADRGSARGLSVGRQSAALRGAQSGPAANTGGMLSFRLERDAITEIANIAVGRAAASLRQIVGHEVLLSVPSVDILSRDAAAAHHREAGQPDAHRDLPELRGPDLGTRAADLSRRPTAWSSSAPLSAGTCRSRTSSTSRTRRSPRPATSSSTASSPRWPTCFKRGLTMSLPSVLRGDGKPAVRRGRRR